MTNSRRPLHGTRPSAPSMRGSIADIIDACLAPPTRLRACHACANKSEAAKSEYRLKQLSRARKLEWVNAHAGNLALMMTE